MGSTSAQGGVRAMISNSVRSLAAAATLLAALAAASPSYADSCSASASATVSRSTGGTCGEAMTINQELTLTYRVRNASVVDSGPNDGTAVESTIFSGAEVVATLAQDDSFAGSTPLPGVLTFVPVCPSDSVGGLLNPGDECDPMLFQCGSAECGCETSLPGVTCTQSGNPNEVTLDLTQDIVFAGGEQQTLASIRVRVTDLVGAPAVCGLFYTRSDSAGDIVVTTDALCDAQVSAGAQASANLHTSECIIDDDCGDPQCNVCVQVDESNVCQPANLGSACGVDENQTDCLAPACVDDMGTGVCEQDQNAANEGLTCDNNDGQPVEPAECRDPLCVGGVCELGEPLDCDDGVDCTTDRCNDAGDACESIPDDSFCDDDQFCNGVEMCDAEEGCEPGTPVVCTDGVECTTDLCNEETDLCEATPDNSLCDDDLFCTGDEICDIEEGCQPGTPPNCDDQIVCTVDTCNEATDMCANAPDNGLCADGLFCNGNEICSPLTGCGAGIPVPCGDAFVCSTDTCNEDSDMCEHNFGTCVCGDSEITGEEICDPPAMAGSYEDCDNLVDDDGDGAIDCRDTDCKPNAREPICDENCELDDTCEVFIRDPARIVFNPKGGPDEIYLHGRIPMRGEFRRVSRGVVFALSNQFGPIYRATLGPDDMRGAVGGRHFRFRDRDAELLGNASARTGLSWVRFRTRKFGGESFIVFTIRAYADLSAANHFMMTTQLSAGPEVGYLTTEWTATPRGWVLHQKDFFTE